MSTGASSYKNSEQNQRIGENRHLNVCSITIRINAPKGLAKMEIDHIFIFSLDKGAEVAALIDFGFIEGSGRTHQGQGTANRKIYFENFFLEIVWVYNELEITSENLLKTKLWERSNFLSNGCSRFGLGFANTSDTNDLFQHALKYQPDYFGKGSQFDIVTNEENPYLPWTFRLPFGGPHKKPDEPIEHRNKIQKLTKVVFNLNTTRTEDVFTRMIEKDSNVRFKTDSKNFMTLEFDHGIQNRMRRFEKLDLVIRY